MIVVCFLKTNNVPIFLNFKHPLLLMTLHSFKISKTFKTNCCQTTLVKFEKNHDTFDEK
jgi:hypothetical protein